MPATPEATDETKRDKRLGGILAAAAQVFAQEGYDRASIRAVAERAGVSVPGLYHYVGSKEELLFLIQYHAFHELVLKLERDSRDVADPEARLELLIQNHLERFLANMAELVVCSREIDRLEGEFRARVGAQQREYFRMAQDVFSELRGRGDGNGVDPRTATLAMFGAINWVHTWYRPGSSPSAARLSRDFARLYLRGVLGGASG